MVLFLFETQISTEFYFSVEICYRLFIGVDIHGLNDEQVVVERDYRIDKRDEDEQMEPAAKGGHDKGSRLVK